MSNQSTNVAQIDGAAEQAAAPRLRVRTKAKSTAPVPNAGGPKGKVAALVALLMRPEGATIEVMQQASGWQAHSVRGAISGSIKKKLGLTVISEKTEGGRVYRIAKGA